MVSPVSLSAAGVVVAGAAAIILGLAYEPAPLPADVVAPVRFAPGGAGKPTVSGPTHRAHRSGHGPTAIPNRPVVFPEGKSLSSLRATGGRGGSARRQVSGARVYGPVWTGEAGLGR
jgi:hypothetical protein